MAVSKKMSKGFEKWLNSKVWKKATTEQLFEVAEEHRKDSNEIAPIDKGNLRRASRTIVRGRYVINEWYIAYAKVRYKKNYKNPASKRWASKAFKQNKRKYTKQLAINRVMKRG